MLEVLERRDRPRDRPRAWARCPGARPCRRRTRRARSGGRRVRRPLAAAWCASSWKCSLGAVHPGRAAGAPTCGHTHRRAGRRAPEAEPESVSARGRCKASACANSSTTKGRRRSRSGGFDGRCRGRLVALIELAHRLALAPRAQRAAPGTGQAQRRGAVAATPRTAAPTRCASRCGELVLERSRARRACSARPRARRDARGTSARPRPPPRPRAARRARTAGAARA